MCELVDRELEAAQRICEATQSPEHWAATVALSDALTEYVESDFRVFRAARDCGISREQWTAIRRGTAANRTV